jgi:hypothetical protein
VKSDVDLDRFNLSNNVIKEIEKLVKANGISYIDGIVHYAQVSGIEIEVLAEIVSKNDVIKSQLEIEAENLNLIKKKTSRLPI